MNLQQLGFVIFLASFPLFGQNTIKGKVYDEYATIKEARIYNETQNIIRFSDDSGNFSIKAEIGDKLILHSLYHNKFYVDVKSKHFEETVVFELTKFTNQLKEVEILRREDKNFNSKETNQLIENQIQTDLIEKHYKYEPPPNTNANILAIVGLIGKLFKKKTRNIEINYLSSEDLKVLFNKDKFFNQKMLLEELKISEKYRFLFFEYCSAKKIDSTLLTNSRDLELLELFVSYSSEFNQLVADNIKSNRKN